MYAVTFEIGLGSLSSSDRIGRSQRSLIKSLSELPGFVNFVALQDDEGQVTGICICEDVSTLNQVKQIVGRWRTDTTPLSVRNVVAQKGL